MPSIFIAPNLVLTGSSPAAVSGLAAERTAGSVAISWNASAGATAYLLERTVDGGASWSTIYTGAGLSTADSIAEGQTFLYRLTANNFWGQQTSSAIVEYPAGAPSLLAQEDVTYLGKYVIPGGTGGDTAYAQGLTHRYVGGQLRFLFLPYSGGHNLCEVAPPGSFGANCTLVRTWDKSQVWNGVISYGRWHGIEWDEELGGLWSTTGVDYPSSPDLLEKPIRFRQLNSNGTCAGHKGPYGFSGISGRETYGGVVKIPSEFQATYGVGPFAAGFGGYASLMSQGGTVSMGPSLYFFNNPESATEAWIPFTRGITCRAGTAAAAWYPANSAPTTFDRGVRNTNYDTYYDTWKNDCPDGLGRWEWGASNWNTGVWLPNNKGFLTVLTCGTGITYYGGSTLHRAGSYCEIQVFDPAAIGQAILGFRQPWDVKPVNRWALSASQFPSRPADGIDCRAICAAATFDATTNRLYLLRPLAGANPFPGDIHVYHLSL